MLKLFLCVMVILSSTLVGNWYSVRISHRRRDIFLLIEAIEKMKNYISFGGYEIRCVVSNSFSSADGFKMFVLDDNLEVGFESWWSESVKNLKNTTALNSEDIELLLKFGNSLGVTDVEGQIANCDLYKTLFSKRFNTAENAECKNFRLYRILGFSFGCVITLIVL